jgi:N-acetylglucosamine kinase-like BadF-type ATPase
MILVADSGSTKCDWALLNEEGYKPYSTQGFNPMFHTSQMVVDGIKANPNFIAKAPYVKEIFYYGAGCQNAVLNRIIENGLAEVFTNAVVHVDHDLTAAVRATAGNEAGISCILGTGSNLAYSDGSEVHTIVSGLGYVLGDEGSGTYFGKKLLADFLYGNLPESMEAELRDIYKLNKDVIIKNVYMKPHANVYISQFMRLVSAYREEQYVQDLVYEGLSRFLEVHVMRFEAHKEVPVHFVGSIAYYFKETLNKACQERGITLGRVVKKPIESLVEFHRQTINQE